jgi:hypothetical protein
MTYENARVLPVTSPAMPRAVTLGWLANANANVDTNATVGDSWGTWTATAVGGVIETVDAHYVYTGTIQTWTVPAGVNVVRIACAAAWGGTHFGAGGGAPGAIVTAKFSVTPSQVYDVRVGGVNGVFGGGQRGSSGENGAPGGDYTCVVLNGSPLTSSLIVAGGGAGRETGQSGGTGGYPNGADGAATGQQGLGGTQSAGGARGADTSGFSITPSTDGSSFQGGRGGGSAGGLDEGGAGGGGGWFGGGGGGNQNGAHQPGGGGSSHYSAAASEVVLNNGANAGNGYVDIYYL